VDLRLGQPVIDRQEGGARLPDLADEVEPSGAGRQRHGDEVAGDEIERGEAAHLR